MNINKNFIIIFGTLILSLIIITGAITYYNEKKEANITDNLRSEVIISFLQDYPTNFKEYSHFLELCGNSVFFNIAGVENKGIKEVGCFIVDKSTIDKSVEDSPNAYTFLNPYVFISSSLKSFASFKIGQYVGISVDLKDVIQNYNYSLLEKDKLYFCGISEPSWADSFVLQKQQKQTLTFNEGDISCAGIPVVEMDKRPFIIYSGFIPKAESLNIKQYLVDEQTVSDVMNKKSFSEIKDTLKDYPIIWQMEKPITI